MIKSPYRIDRSNPFTILSVILMAACAIIRVIYFVLRPASPAELAAYLILPLTSAVTFITIILFFGNRYTHLTVIPVFLGVVFFIIKAFTFDTVIHTVLCIILYTVVLVLYFLTVLGVIPTKLLLYPLFTLPLLYHILVEDMQIYILANPRPPFIEWLPEISVLCIMAALLSLSHALEKNNIGALV